MWTYKGSPMKYENKTYGRVMWLAGKNPLNKQQQTDLWQNKQ